MLSIRQIYLTKLAEECAEVAQRCAKSMQFGANEIQKDQDRTNAQRLRDEVEDLLAVISLVELYTEDLPAIPVTERISRMTNKASKIQKYLKYSQSLGMVENDRDRN